MQLLCEEYDTVIIPTPMFSTFFVEWFARSRVLIEAAETKAEENFDITLECLDAAWEKSTKNGKRPKVLVLVQPNNPTGKMYSYATL